VGVCYTTGPRDMFNIGFGELAVICIVLIIAVGPERLPSMMKTLGKTLRTLRQASRDIRASTGIDELMREDFDLYAPIKPQPPRRPAIAASAEPAALPATTEVVTDVPPAVVATVDSEPKPVSREEVVDEGRPSVVVAPPAQAIGLPSADPAEAAQPVEAAQRGNAAQPAEAEQPSAAVTDVSAPAPQLTAAADPSVLPRESSPPAPVASTGDTLPRAPIIKKPEAAADDLAKNDSPASEPKQSGA
jgi:sec-independent protein translocase protein TatB